MMETGTVEELGKVLIIGGGKMGEAVMAAILRMPGFKREDMMVANPGEKRREDLSETYGVTCVADACEAPHARTIVLAVKPQVLENVVCKATSDGVFADAALVISIAAGKTTATIEQWVPSPCSVVRVMPNMPMRYGCGAAAVSGGSRSSEKDVRIVMDVFAAAGEAVCVPEELQGAVTAISGNGPAYFALFIDELSKAGQRQGLSDEAASRLALQTMRGTVEALSQENVTVEGFIDSVSSKGGTTEAALAAMRDSGIGAAIDAGIEAAVRRSRELA